jgi:hypothetical protein
LSAIANQTLDPAMLCIVQAKVTKTVAWLSVVDLRR